MLRIAVVEDDFSDADAVGEHVRRWCAEHGEDFTLTCFTDGDGLLESYCFQFDVILMDIEMHFVDGITAAEEVRGKDPEVVIIFITNMPQYAIRGYSVDALDYCLKPVSYFAFSRCMDRASKRLAKRETRYTAVTLKGGGIQKLNIANIFYLESQGHNLIYHTKYGVFVSSGVMREAEKNFPEFFRGNKGYLINLDYVDGIRDGCAIVGGDALVISRARRNAFMEALTNYLGGSAR
ncbi:MAG: LytTR family DNA-binding domain-containing protein [Clostridiales bacterium]|jgi:DNA-binding LytR/AlgR family response regulator|nr:LytTR family DNA-binding domain-containing protein [Clostridiales bacterium]